MAFLVRVVLAFRACAHRSGLARSALVVLWLEFGFGDDSVASSILLSNLLGQVIEIRHERADRVHITLWHFVQVHNFEPRSLWHAVDGLDPVGCGICGIGSV